MCFEDACGNGPPVSRHNAEAFDPPTRLRPAAWRREREITYSIETGPIDIEDASAREGQPPSPTESQSVEAECIDTGIEGPRRRDRLSSRLRHERTIQLGQHARSPDRARPSAGTPRAPIDARLTPVKVFVTHNPEDLVAYYGRALPALRALADVVLNPLDRDLSTPELIDAAAGCDVIVAHRATPGDAATFESLPTLKAFLRSRSTSARSTSTPHPRTGC